MKNPPMFRYPRERWLYMIGFLLGYASSPVANWLMAKTEAWLTGVVGPPPFAVFPFVHWLAFGWAFCLMVYVALRDEREAAEEARQQDGGAGI